MQSLFSKITRGVALSRRLYHYHPRGDVYSIHPREIGRWRDQTQTWSWRRFICAKAPNVPEGEPLPVPVPVPMPVPVQVQVPVPEPVLETVHVGKSHHDQEVKGGGDLWDVVYPLLQILATVLAILAALCTISGYVKKMTGDEKKKFEEFSRRNDQLFVAMILHLRTSEQILEILTADRKAKKESWFFKVTGYK